MLLSEFLSKFLCPIIAAINKRKVTDEDGIFQGRWTESVFAFVRWFA
jgi:hypothetical protein